MRLRKLLFPIILLAAGYGAPAQDKRYELGLTLGAVLKDTRGSGAGELKIGAGTAFQANFALRLGGNQTAALLGEVHFLASPLREVTSARPQSSRDFASLYVTPGIRVKFVPDARVSPWLSAGGGYALYENSELRQDGRPNEAPRFTNRGAFCFGGGVDIRVKPWLALRGEIRDFYTGNPGLNVSTNSSGQHNVVVGGGFVLRF